MAAYLAVLLPGLGSPPASADRATVFEAVRCAFEAIAPASADGGLPG